jgi:protein phosphatase
MKIRQVASICDIGPKRKVNEDAVLTAPDLPLFAIADGTGGTDTGQLVIDVLHAKGHVLAEHGRRVKDDASTASRLAIGQFFEDAFEAASATLRTTRDERGGEPLAASLVAATVLDHYCYIAHVGDTRAYLWRKGELRCLTNDHTLAMLQLQRGEISMAEYTTSPFRHTLSQALGVSPHLSVDIAEVQVLDGDVIVLCSNGVTRSIRDEQIGAFAQRPDLTKAAAELLDATRSAQARDNISAVFFEVADDVSERTAPSIANVVDTVRQVFLFRMLSEPQWLAVAPYIEERSFADGEVIYRAGDDGDAFYIVGDGLVHLRRDGRLAEEIGPGETFGALALSGSFKRLEQATAAGSTVAFTMSRQSFRKILSHKPVLGARLALGLIHGLGGAVVELSGKLSAVRRAISDA